MVRFEDLVNEAVKISEGRVMAFDDFVRKVEEYVASLPERAKDAAIVVPSAERPVVVTRRELPRKLREDPEFFRAFVKWLSQYHDVRKWLEGFLFGG